MNIMLDLETMGDGPCAAIVAIGAVVFGPGLPVDKRQFYRRVNLQSSLDAGLEMSASTVQWWMRRNAEARMEVASATNLMLPDALQEFSDWVHSFRSDYPDRRVWGHGANFDNVILRSAFNACGINCPWPYWGDRCYRSLIAVRSDIPAEPPEIKHHALQDAIAQAKHASILLAAMTRQQPSLSAGI